MEAIKEDCLIFNEHVASSKLLMGCHVTRLFISYIYTNHWHLYLSWLCNGLAALLACSPAHPYTVSLCVFQLSCPLLQQ